MPAPALPHRRLLLVVNVSWFFISHRLALAERAIREGYEVHLATRVTSAEDSRTIQAAGVVLHDLPIGRGDSGALNDLKSMLALIRLFRRLRPDIIHLVTVKPIIVGGVAARLTGANAVVAAASGLGHAFTDKGIWPAIRRTLAVSLFRFVTSHPRCVVICQNPDDLGLLTELGIATPEASRLIRGAGVDLESYRPAPEPSSPLRVLLASRMLRTKGVREFVACAQQLRGRWPDVEFVLAGDTDPANPASLEESELRAWNKQGFVRWIGHVRDMPALLASSHIVTLPSYDREGVPKVLIEAAACGRPIVTTDIPGCREIVLDGQSGFLVTPQDAAALAEAVQKLLEAPRLRADFGAAGRRLAESVFGQETVFAQTLEVYSGLLAVPSTP